MKFVTGILEEVYSRKQYMGERERSRECKGVGRRI